LNLSNIIKERRSIGQFADRPVSRELIAELLDTAIWVPNHYVTEPWRFIFVEGEGKRRIAEAQKTLAQKWISEPQKKEEQGKKAYENMMNIPAFLIVVMKEAANPMTREEDFASTCCVIQNFSLLAWEKGIGCIWKTYGLMYQRDFRELLGIEPGEKVVGVVHIGYPSNIPTAKPRKLANERLTLITESGENNV
jgi:nitroreductase